MFSTRQIYIPLLHFVRHTNSQSVPYVLSKRVDSCIQVLTLNDEKKANCLSSSMISELHTALRDIGRDPDVRALIISGAGRFFSAGHDLNEIDECTTTESRSKLFNACSQMMQELSDLSVPSVAAIRGPALAAGCQLVAACDLAVSGQSSTFSTPGVKLGLFCSTPAVPLVRAIGLRAAKELLLTGHTIKAQRAYELGLVHRVVPDDQVMDAALELAREIAQHSKPVVALGKCTLNKQASVDSTEVAYTISTEAILKNLQFKDTQSGIRSFVRKQPMPKWSHRAD